MLDANNNGIPDFMEDMMASQNLAGQQMSMNVAQTSPMPVANAMPVSMPMSSSTIEPEHTSKWVWIVLGLVLVGTCLVLLGAVPWYYFCGTRFGYSLM